MGVWIFMRWTRNLRVARLTAVLAVGVLGLAACGGSDSASSGSAGPSKGGAPIVLASFNFTDSQVLAEVYAQALEAKGYPITRKLNLGTRELIYPELKKGDLQFLPEYQGAAITTGFNGTAPKDPQSEHTQLEGLFAPYNVGLLNYAQAENKNTFLVKADLAKSKGLTKLSDLKKLDKVVLGGGPECEARIPCFKGLTDVYKLTNASFEAIQEAGPRLEQLKSGAITMIVVDSVDPLVGDPSYVALTDDLGIVPTENIVPAVNKKVLTDRGADFAAAVNAVSAKLTTAELRGMDKSVDSDGDAAADVAKDWLSKEGLS